MSRSDDMLALHLARGLSVQAAAAKCGITARTAFRRLQWADFRAKVEEVRLELLKRTIARVSSLGARAVKELWGLLSSSEESVRLRAVKLTLEYTARSNEVFVVAQQVAELKKQIEGLRHGTPTQANGRARGRTAGSGTGGRNGTSADTGRVPGQAVD